MNGTELIKYEAAKRALAEAKAVDEVKDIRDKAKAMREYAKQAQDKTLLIDALEIQRRAERRLAEMIKEQKQTRGLNRGGHSTGGFFPPVETAIPTLASQGISKDLAKNVRTVGKMTEEKFEAAVRTESDSQFYQRKPSKTKEEYITATSIIFTLDFAKVIAKDLYDLDLNKFYEHNPASLSILRDAYADVLARIDAMLIKIPPGTINVVNLRSKL